MDHVAAAALAHVKPVQLECRAHSIRPPPRAAEVRSTQKTVRSTSTLGVVCCIGARIRPPCELGCIMITRLAWPELLPEYADSLSVGEVVRQVLDKLDNSTYCRTSRNRNVSL